MTDIVLDRNTHDIDFSSGGAQLHTTNTEALAQRLKIAILLHRGEWYPNILDGVPYQTQFFTIKNNKAFIDSFMNEYIFSVDGVEEIVSYSSEVTNTRKLILNFSVRTTEGQIYNFLMEI